MITSRKTRNREEESFTSRNNDFYKLNTYNILLGRLKIIVTLNENLFSRFIASSFSKTIFF